MTAPGKGKRAEVDAARRATALMSLGPRLWAQVAIGDGCWLWTGIVNPRGYGIIGRTMGDGTRQKLLAHRAAWIVTNGEIPAGMFVCHRCDNPPCCNPAHLFLGTHTDNMRDMHAKGRGTVGARVNTAKLTSEKVQQMRAEWTAGGVTKTALAAAFGVSDTTVCEIIDRRTWKHVADSSRMTRASR